MRVLNIKIRYRCEVNYLMAVIAIFMYQLKKLYYIKIAITAIVLCFGETQQKNSPLDDNAMLCLSNGFCGRRKVLSFFQTLFVAEG